MNIILGFGKTETDFEEQEFDFVEKFIIEYVKNNPDIKDKGFTDDVFQARLVDEIGKRDDYYKKMDKKYKTAKEYPDRYSYFYPSIVNNWSNLCVIFKFHHVNRRHPFSPDGWALMTTKKVYYADLWDFID